MTGRGSVDHGVFTASAVRNRQPAPRPRRRPAGRSASAAAADRAPWTGSVGAGRPPSDGTFVEHRRRPSDFRRSRPPTARRCAGRPCAGSWRDCPDDPRGVPMRAFRPLSLLASSPRLAAARPPRPRRGRGAGPCATATPAALPRSSTTPCRTAWTDTACPAPSCRWCPAASTVFAKGYGLADAERGVPFDRGPVAGADRVDHQAVHLDRGDAAGRGRPARPRRRREPLPDGLPGPGHLPTSR